jgi:hypothetical protein
MYRGFQLTQVHGPLWLSDTQLLLGGAVPAGADRPRSRVTGKVFGGSIQGDARVWLRDSGQFDLQVQLINADLAQLVRDVSQRPARVHGRSYGVLRLAGTGAGTHTLRGDGHVGLYEADIGELPLIVALLNMLYGTTDRTAFNSSEAKFRVLGEAIYLDQIDLRGDAMTLKGQGEMSLDGQIDLDFYSLLGRERDYLPAVLPFLGEASRRFLRIHVSGTLDEPRTTQNVLPFVNETLQQLFPEATSPRNVRFRDMNSTR